LMCLYINFETSNMQNVDMNVETRSRSIEARLLLKKLNINSTKSLISIDQ
jgi:hypothetical protein